MVRQGDHGSSLHIEPNAVEEEEITLEERILNVIDTCTPQYEIRPGRLAQELGISIEDASAELSYLLAAVGGGHDGATFRFEDVAVANATTKTMVFQFPPDFRRRLLNKQRKEDFQHVLKETLEVIVKLLKIITAFGLIVSLLILSVAAIVGLVGAIIAMSRVEGGHRHRSLLMHQIRSIFYTLRQILWLYALFGPADESSGDGSDPFFKEVAYDLFLFLSVCCGNPGSLFFWIRAGQWQSRRRRGRGIFHLGTFASDIPGVTLISNHRDEDTAIDMSSSPHRGFLSVAVEFLFGPTPFEPGPTLTQVGLLRAAVLSKLSFEHPAVILEQLVPYVDDPPETLEDSPKIVQQGLLIVSYFHGVPSQSADPTETSQSKASFCFPELCAESTISLPRHFPTEENDDDIISLQALLYEATNESSSSNRYSSVHQTDQTVPTFLKEDLYRLTRLTPRQFYQCVGLGTLNLVGVVWFHQSLETYIKLPPFLAYAVGRIIMPMLLFYALLYFALPLGRLLCVIIWNQYRIKRNRRRKVLSKQLQSKSETTVL